MGNDEKILVKKTDYFMLLMVALFTAKNAEEAQVMVNSYMENQSESTKKQFLEHLNKYSLILAESNGEKNS